MPPYRIDKLMSGMTYSVWLKAVSTTGIESPPGNKNNHVSTTIPLEDMSGNTTLHIFMLSGHFNKTRHFAGFCFF